MTRGEVSCSRARDPGSTSFTRGVTPMPWGRDAGRQVA